MRAKDIQKVEYYDLPTGKFANDNASINFVMKKPIEGGYTQLDAMQGVGYLQGDYNFITKYATPKYNFNVWGGYRLENPKEKLTESEYYNFPTEPLIKNVACDDISHRNDHAYGAASVSHSDNKTIWMLRGGIDKDWSKKAIENGAVTYSSRLPNATLSDKVTNDNLKASMYFYFLNRISTSQYVEVEANAYYANTNFNQNYSESDENIISSADDDYYYANVKALYGHSFKNNHNLTITLNEFYRNSRSEYTLPSYLVQKLYSSETVLFANYSKRWKNGWMFSITPGISYQIYQLKGEEAVGHLNPRLNAMASYMRNDGHRLQFLFALGNTYPTLNTVNNATLQLDRLMTRRGNPKLGNATLLQPRVTYTVSKPKWSLSATLQYLYINHLITNSYSIENENIINSYADATRYHRPSLDLSLVFKPSEQFNLKFDGGYKHTRLCGLVSESQNTCWGNLYAEIYLGDFLIQPFVATPQKDIVSNQVLWETPWMYGISGKWSRNVFSAELQVNNLFLSGQETKGVLDADVYRLITSSVDANYNAYATLKLSYTFEYGKKVGRSPKYQTGRGESTIIEGRY
ncbi:MAG: hypothetical protein IJY64_03385 [Bacteroidaceae bacterium]|nr:hypothetical protein [Bacteroidaceae bacterium]